jgi:Ca-activated chloride channel homolog
MLQNRNKWLQRESGMMNKMINFSATSHRSVYPVLNTPQQAYFLFEVCPAIAAIGSATAPINYCLVLDRSGSMAGEKLSRMKEAAQMVIDHLRPDDMIAVVAFDDEEPANLVVPSGVVRDRERLKQKIGMIEERGGTHMSTGMRLGLDELIRCQRPGYVSSMLLLTDGQTWEDQQLCRDLADQCRSAGVSIYSMGLGIGGENNWDPRLLEDLAQRSGGEWLVIETPDQACTVFEKIVKAGQNMAMTNVGLTIRMVRGVSPRSVWRVTPQIGRLDQQEVGERDVQVYLGDLQGGKRQSVLAEMVLPARPAGIYRLAQADIIYNIPGPGQTDQKESIDLVITFSEDSIQFGQLDGRVMNIIERVVAHKLQTRALDEAELGEIAHATRRLRAAATRLLDLGEVELAQAAEQQATHIEQDGRIDLAAVQKMRYATKRLVDPDITQDYF